MKITPVFTEFIAEGKALLSYKDTQSIIEYLRGEEDNYSAIGQTTPKVTEGLKLPASIDTLQSIVEKKFNEVHVQMGLSNRYKQVVSEIWLNFRQNNEINRAHRHPGFCLVAVYYPLAHHTSFLTLLNAGSNLNYEIPNDAIAEYSALNSSQHLIPVVADTIIIVPSWIWHFVESSAPEGSERLSIVFNSHIIKLPDNTKEA